MKRFAFLGLLAFCLATVMMSCQKEDVSPNPLDEAQLRTGTWVVDHVEINQFDNGNLISSEYIAFGEGEQGGICTFHYGDKIWTMNDNGAVSEITYRTEDNIIYTAGGGTWGVREMSDTHLEMTLRGEEVNNPCQFNAAGAVYHLTRPAAATRQ